MLKKSTLKIYNASAGSGKTYYLILNYLIILLKNNKLDIFKKILILTFNKKVSIEIKIKILDTLTSFSKGEKTKIFFDIKSYLKITSEEIKLKSKNILLKIFYNYELFNIVTIDKFIYEIFKNSITYLDIDKNFIIELNNKILIKKAIKIYEKKIYNSKFYNNILIENIKNSINKGNRWNLKKYFSNIYSFFLKEKNLLYINKYNISIDQFHSLHNTINKNILYIKNELISQSNSFYNFIKKNNISVNILIYNFFDKIYKKNLLCIISKNLFTKKIENILLSNRLIKSKSLDKESNKKLTKEIIDIYLNTKKYILKCKNNYIIFDIIKNNIFFLLLVYEVIKIINNFKKQTNTFSNTDINIIINNKIINNEILPYYYENIGEKYVHYFIDEFQDISFLQWNNIKILIENTLSQNGKVLLCGDPKQSIYRWRGSKVENFLNLVKQYNFSYIKEIKYSIYNYRSCKEIVEFNNSFYFLASKNFKNKLYKKVYTDNIKQKYHDNLDKKGYVEINFLSKKNYLEEVSKIIINRIRYFLLKGFKKKDIVILTRKNKEIFDLNKIINENGIETLSSDSLLLKNYWQIICIITLLKIIHSPHNSLLRVKWLFLLKNNNIINCSETIFHNFLFKISNLSLENFFLKLKIFGINLYKNLFSISCFYIFIEKIIKSIHLNRDEICLQHFLDFIFLNLKNINNSIKTFLDFWNLKKNEESIYISENIDGIKIMTIHKSKGLEFKIVILPFVYWDILNNKNYGDWISIDPNVFNGKKFFYVKMNNKMLNADITEKIYKDYIDKSHLDNLNLLYVATTRATDKMLIFSINNKILNKKNNISYYIYNFLVEKNIFIDKKLKYSFGEWILLLMLIKIIFFI